MGGNTKSIKHATFAAGIASLSTFALKHAGQMAFSLLMQQGDDLVEFERTSQPCYGEMRKYGRSHPELTGPRAKDPKPYDLVTPFPEGKPMAVALAFRYSATKEDIPALDDFLSVILDKNNSPWRNALLDIEVVRSEEGIARGIVFKDTNIDSTLLVDLWMTLRYRLNKTGLKAWAALRELAPDINPNILILSLSGLNPYELGQGQGMGFTLNWTSDYYLHQKLDTKRFLTGDNVQEGLLIDNYPYNRPEIHFVFGKQEQSIFVPFAANTYTNRVSLTSADLREKFLDKFAAIVSDGNTSVCNC